MVIEKLSNIYSHLNIHEEIDQGTSLQLSSQSWGKFTCDDCGAEDIAEEREGFVCRNCGLVVAGKKLAHSHGYRENTVINALQNTTQVGTRRDRLTLTNSSFFEKLNRYNGFKAYEEEILHKTKAEIARIFHYLQLPKIYIRDIFQLAKDFRSNLELKIFRNPEKLVPVVISLFMRFHLVPINDSELQSIAKLEKKQFNSLKLQIITKGLRDYSRRPRKEYVEMLLMLVSEQFELDETFYPQALVLLNEFWGEEEWNGIKNTSDKIIAGLISVFTLFSSPHYNPKEISVKAICEFLGLHQGALNNTLKTNKKHFEKFRRAGVKSLVKDRDKIRTVLMELGLVIYLPKVISITTGNAAQAFNHFSRLIYYISVLKTQKNTILANSNRFYDINYILLNNQGILFYNLTTLKIKNYEYRFELEILKYYTGKDPPSITNVNNFLVVYY